MRSAAAFALLLALGSAGCEPKASESPAHLTVDTVGTTVVVTNPAAPSGPADTLHARPVATIGAEEGAAEMMFGSISSIAVDEVGRIYVADAMAGDVRVYTPEGRFVERIGREGDGPGEFRRPTGLAFGPSINLYVRDDTRVQRFGRPSDAAPARYIDSYPGVAYGHALMSSRLDRAGRLYFPHRSGRVPDQRHVYVVFDSAGSTVDTLRLPASVRVPPETAVYRTGPSGGRMVEGLSRAPFAPVASWDVTPDGNLLLAGGAAYELVEVDASGDTVRVIRKPGEPRTVPAAELRDSTRALGERVAAAPAPLEQLEGVAEEIRSGRLPDVLPQIRSVHVGTDGRIWVQRWPRSGDAGSVYDVFSREGVHENTVSIPVRFAALPVPVFSDRRVHGVVLDADTDVQKVAVFDLDAP